MKRRLLTVQGPLQYIAGYIAFRWNNPPLSDVEDVLLLYDFLSAPQIEDQIAEVVRTISTSSPWARVVFVSGREMRSLMRSRYSHSIRRLRTLIGGDHFDEIYLARDHIGHGSPLLLNAYPTARKLSYGDSFGLVGQRESLGALEAPVSIQMQLRFLLRRLLLGGPRHIGFDGAVLSLPIDMSGSYLRSVELIVPSKTHVLACMEQVYGTVPDLRSYCQTLCKAGPPDKSQLYLLSNLSGSGLTDERREVELYAEVIRERSPLGGTVYLKPHPRSTFDVLDGLVGRLEHDFQLIVVDDRRFARMPVELWIDLIHHCEVVAMFSTSAINLKYLFSKQVIMPLTEARIVRYLDPAATHHVSSLYRMMRESLVNLDTWDGSSALWSAPG